jgi:hypothetical protein
VERYCNTGVHFKLLIGGQAANWTVSSSPFEYYEYKRVCAPISLTVFLQTGLIPTNQFRVHLQNQNSFQTVILLAILFCKPKHYENIFYTNYPFSTHSLKPFNRTIPVQSGALHHPDALGKCSGSLRKSKPKRTGLLFRRNNF